MKHDHTAEILAAFRKQDLNTKTDTMFIITDSAHRDCADCRALYGQAVTTARIGGTPTARFTIVDRERGSSVHWVQVNRAKDIGNGVPELRHQYGHYNNDDIAHVASGQ